MLSAMMFSASTIKLSTEVEASIIFMVSVALSILIGVGSSSKKSAIKYVFVDELGTPGDDPLISNLGIAFIFDNMLSNTSFKVGEVKTASAIGVSLFAKLSSKIRLYPV